MASFDAIFGRQHLFAWGSVWSIDMFWVWLTGGAWENLLDTGICSTSTSFTRSTFISISSVDEKIVWSGNIHMCIFVKSSPSHVESWDKFMVSRWIVSLISDVGIEIWWVVADVILKDIFKSNFPESLNFWTKMSPKTSDFLWKFTLNVSGATAGSTSENSAMQQALQTETPNGKRFPGAASAGSLLVGNLKHWFKPKLFLWWGCVGPLTHLFPNRKKLFS